MRYAIFLVAYFIASISSARASEHVISMTIDAGSIYRTEDKITDLAGLHEIASNQYSRYGQDVEYHVLFKDDVKLSSVLNVKKTLQAIGYSRIKYFVFSSEKIYMVEVNFGKISPYDGG